MVDPEKIVLFPHHMKLGLVKSFVKALGKANSNGFEYLKGKFSFTSTLKLKEGVFMGPQIRELMHNEEFQN